MARITLGLNGDTSRPASSVCENLRSCMFPPRINITVPSTMNMWSTSMLSQSQPVFDFVIPLSTQQGLLPLHRHSYCMILWLSLALSDKLTSSCARHRFVAASSRSTDEKVASRNGSGKHCRNASRARALSLSLHISSATSTPLARGVRTAKAHLKKQRTTCLSSRTVCCSTSCCTILLSTVPTA